MKRLLLTFVALFCVIWEAHAQQDPQYTMYMFNRMAINPGYAGALHQTEFTLLGRSQWVGIEGAPQTFTASANGYVKKIRGGIGGYLIGDQLGPITTAGARVAYAFHLPLDMEDKARLQFGVDGGFYSKTLDVSNFRYNQDGGVDPTLPLSNVSDNVLDLGAGVYFTLQHPDREFERAYIGVSASHLLEPELSAFTTNSLNQTNLSRHFTAIAGYRFNINSTHTVQLQPNTYVRTDGSSLQFDLNCNLYVSPMVFGISHRWKESYSGIVGFNVSDRFFIAYSYDYVTGPLRQFTSGSHELVLNYRLPTKFKQLPVEPGVLTDPDHK